MDRITNVCTEPNRAAIVIHPLSSRRPKEAALWSVTRSLPDSRSLLRLVALWSEAAPISLERRDRCGYLSPFQCDSYRLSLILLNFGIRDEIALPIWEKSFPEEKLLPIEGNLFHTVVSASNLNRTGWARGWKLTPRRSAQFAIGAKSRIDRQSRAGRD